MVQIVEWPQWRWEQAWVSDEEKERKIAIYVVGSGRVFGVG